MLGRTASVCLRSGAARSTRRKPLATARFGRALPRRPSAGQPRSSRAQVRLRPRDLRRVPPADGLVTAQDCHARPPVGSRLALPPALLRLICPNELPCHFLVTAIDVRELLSSSEFRFSLRKVRGHRGPLCKLYRNQSGLTPPAPRWSSDPRPRRLR